jgi:glycosyltransferase involved in cell wall biosynthesis
MKNADRITFISSAMLEVYGNFYTAQKHKMSYVYNGFDLDDFKGFAFEKLDNKKLTIFYAGSFYKGVRSPIPLLALLDESFKKKFLLQDEVIIQIAGNFEQELLEEAQKYDSFSCIDFLGRIPRTEVLRRLTKSSLLWLIVGNEITHYTGVPIKFYEYLAARRPIINFAPNKSEPTKIIKDLELGVSFNSNNFILEQEIGKFKEMINKFRDGNLSEPLNPSLAKEFTRDKQTLLFQELM